MKDGENNVIDTQKDFEKEAIEFGFKPSQLVKNCSGEYQDTQVRVALWFFLSGIQHMCKDIKKYL